MDKPEKHKTVKICRKKILTILLFIVGLLILANLTSLVLKYGYEYQHQWGLTRLFSFERRDSIPHYFISLLLLISSILLYLIAMSYKSSGKRNWTQWSILSLVFLYMSLDKLLWIRELAIQMLCRILANSGFNSPSRDLLKVTVLVLFATLFLRFFLQLPSRVRLMFFIAAVLFVAGELGGDILSHKLYIHNDDSNINYIVISMIEELMEMLGIVVFVYALLGYLAEYVPRKTFIFVKP